MFFFFVKTEGSYYASEGQAVSGLPVAVYTGKMFCRAYTVLSHEGGSLRGGTK